MSGLFKKKRQGRQITSNELKVLGDEIGEVKLIVESMYRDNVLQLSTLRECRRSMVESIINRRVELDNPSLVSLINRQLINMIVHAVVYDKLIKSRMVPGTPEANVEKEYSLMNKINSRINRADCLKFDSKEVILAKVIEAFNTKPFEPVKDNQNQRDYVSSPRSVINNRF